MAGLNSSISMKNFEKRSMYLHLPLLLCRWSQAETN
jgi:hypothetical protein